MPAHDALLLFASSPLRCCVRRLSVVCAVVATGCATTSPVPLAKAGTPARARQDYTASLDVCQAVRASQLSTLGPPIFQPISGDQPFNECLGRAKTALDRALDEAD
jgi:hypothetical protein